MSNGGADLNFGAFGVRVLKNSTPFCSAESAQSFVCFHGRS
jgi:hypothetical protein